MSFHPRLRSILLSVNLCLLLLPLLGIWTAKLYESHLVRQTESDLLGQGALVSAAFGQAFLGELKKDAGDFDERLARVSNPLFHFRTKSAAAPYDPIEAKLDLMNDPIYPPAAEATAAIVNADPISLAAGQAVGAILTRAKQMTLSGIRVIDRNGVVVASSGTEMGLSLASRMEVLRVLKGEYLSLLRERMPGKPTRPLESISRGTLVRVFVAIPVIENNRVLGAVLLSRTPLDMMKGLYIIRGHLLMVGLLLLSVMLAITLLTDFIISRPVRALVDQTLRIGKGDTSAQSPIRHPGTHEVALLSESLAEMARAQSEREQYIRSFANAVSHEFKGPLASLKGAAELLEDSKDEMDAQEFERFVRMIGEDTERLTRLVGRLQEMARADVLRPGDETSAAEQVLNALVGRFSALGMDVSLTAPPELCRVRIAREEFESLLSNLLENAKQHGGPQVKVSLRAWCESHGEKRELHVLVADNGPGVSEANRGKIFTPFFTTARAKGGSGMGLPIVKTILAAHGGTIRLLPSESGATFELRLPLVE